MKTVILYKDDFKTEKDGHHCDAWEALLSQLDIEPIPGYPVVEEVELSVELKHYS